MARLDRSLALSAILLFASCGGQAPADTSASQAAVAEVGPTLVSEGIYRSRRPTADELKWFADQGGAIVLDLENDQSAIDAEQPIVEGLGMTFYSEQMSGFWSPDDDQVNRILSFLADSNNRPVLIHCQHGQDRTGLIVGLHRVFNEGKDPGAAYREMLQFGFHKALVFLNHYYEDRTGYED